MSVTVDIEYHPAQELLKVVLEGVDRQGAEAFAREVVKIAKERGAVIVANSFGSAK